ncbi:up-regulator of cell proliferation isoform X2 [Silurus meridionalis]|nr:up-regulator of cell proliferation isoform X2 [Silurus meridionalis]
MDEYKAACYSVRRAVKDAKRRYGRKLESQFQQGGSRNLWQGLRTITDYRTPSSRMVDADAYLADEAAANHASGASSTTSVHAERAGEVNTFTISKHDMRRAFKRVNTRKAAGPECITGRVLKACADQLAPVFTEIFNLSLKQSVVPSCFKQSTIVPVPKKPQPACLNDYRPVAMASVVMKCFERLVRDFITASLPDTLDPLQFAYRENRLTEDAIAHRHTTISHLDQKNGNYTKMLFVDYSSAFNTIIPSTLTSKLEVLGLSLPLYQWISNFLTGRPQAVWVGKHTSSTLTLSTGAPQGCVLRPLLYSLYTYDCVATSNSTTIIKFADDTVVVGRISNNDETAYLQEVKNLERWCQVNNLLLNVSKTKELIVDFSTKQERVSESSSLLHSVSESSSLLHSVSESSSLLHSVSESSSLLHSVSESSSLLHSVSESSSPLHRVSESPSLLQHVPPPSSSDGDVLPPCDSEGDVTPLSSSKDDVTPLNSSFDDVSLPSFLEGDVSPQSSSFDDVSLPSFLEGDVSPQSSSFDDVSLPGFLKGDISPQGSSFDDVSPQGSSDGDVSPPGSFDGDVSPPGSSDGGVQPPGSSDSGVEGAEGCERILAQQVDKIPLIQTPQCGSEFEERNSANFQDEELNLKVIKELLCRLGLENKYEDKLTKAEFLEISKSTLQNKEPSKENELVHVFMKRLLTGDYTARQVSVKTKLTDKKSQDTDQINDFAALFKKTENKECSQTLIQIHPMDVQMALFLCADDFLRQIMVNKLAQCQYAIPLLVPNPFSGKIECPLWTIRQINKNWKSSDASGEIISKTLPVYKAETPMVAFFRLGSVSSSKSQLINHLINEKHNTFFHKHCPGSSRTRLLMDGVVEIAWYCPAGKRSDHFSECVAFCNLHGDSSIAVTQREILTTMASVNVILLPKLDEEDHNMGVVQECCKSQTPLIVVLTDEEDDNEDALCEINKGKYRVTLKGRNQSDVSVLLRDVIKNCLLQKHTTFILENMTRNSKVSVDESNESCKRGKEAAQKMMCLLDGKDPLIVKEKYLPCQGKLWHDWCQKSKELQRLGNMHLLREMGQIYEASVSEEKNMTGKGIGNFSYLPELAAELLISGHPVELMDGDTAYVPLTWVSALLDEVIKKLGDPRVFVLSVLGIQSSGKSTMLNAMFGLEFAVSAGRCTRGAFMQLVKVSEDKKKDLKFDYILVVDTGGLRSSERFGNNSIQDNELSTFVVGLGNVTLININGENLLEMQEILQIVVHAFLRMKQVRFKTSCMFVHQNVSDITAGEKIRDGRRHLQETLDTRTKLAAKDEDCCTGNFTDVIAFDVENDVKYIAQFWEGSPPMAPPNPHYSENIQELKRDIISRAATTDVLKLSQFQKHLKDLWNALLNENYVFSFKNAKDISVHEPEEELLVAYL